MRWRNNQVGDTRIQKKSLIFPKTIGDETRWLEVAEWEETFKYVWNGPLGYPQFTDIGYWRK